MEIVWPKPKTWDTDTAMTINQSSDNYKMGFNACLKECREAAEEAKPVQMPEVNRKYKIAKEALWAITTDYHEDNPDRHINPVSAWEVAEKALKSMGEMKNDDR